MTTETSAAAVVESATTPEIKEFNNWDAEGTPVRTEQPKTQDSAPAKEAKEAVADPAPQKDASASESATEKGKPHLKTKEDTEKRFTELLDQNKALQRRLESLERGKPETRENQQTSQPAPETFKPLDEKEFFAKNAKATYEDFVRAAARHEAKWEVKQELAADRQRQAEEAAGRELAGQVEQAKTRYPDFDMDTRILPATQAIAQDAQIPFPVKAVLNASPVFVDLMYVLSEPKALADLIQTAKINPAGAIRKIVLTEQLVQAELAKASGKAKAEAGRDESGKFVSGEKKEVSETKPRAPKPPTEVGGRGTTPEDALRTAAEANDFRSFEAEQNRRLRASKR